MSKKTKKPAPVVPAAAPEQAPSAPSSYPLIAQPKVLPQSQPCEYAIGDTVDPEGKRGLAIQFSSPTGLHFVFFDTTSALQLADTVRAAVAKILMGTTPGAS